MRDRLRSVHQHDGAVFVCGIDDALHRQHRPQHVGNVRDGHEPRAGIEQLQELIEQQLAAAIDRCDLQGAAGLFAHHLPGDDVRVMLEGRDENFIAGAEARAGIRLRDEIDALRGAANEDDLAGRARIDKAAHPLPRALVRLGGRLTQRVHATMHIRVTVGLVVLDGTQDRQRALSGGAAVEVDEWAAVDGPLQDREIPADALGVERRRRYGM